MENAEVLWVFFVCVCVGVYNMFSSPVDVYLN